MQNGATKTAANAINRLAMISADKNLKPVYETVIKEMMICYCVNPDQSRNVGSLENESLYYGIDVQSIIRYNCVVSCKTFNLQNRRRYGYSNDSRGTCHGRVSLGKCSVSTLYRWCKAINEYLERDHFDWRVKANRKNMTIDVKED